MTTESDEEWLQSSQGERVDCQVCKRPPVKARLHELVEVVVRLHQKTGVRPTLTRRMLGNKLRDDLPNYRPARRTFDDHIREHMLHCADCRAVIGG